MVRTEAVVNSRDLSTVDQPDGNSKADGTLTVFGALTDESVVRAEGGDYAA